MRVTGMAWEKTWESPDRTSSLASGSLDPANGQCLTRHSAFVLGAPHAFGRM